MKRRFILPKAYRENILAFKHLEEKVVVFFGGRGGGKTYGIATSLIILAIQNPNYRIFCARENKDDYIKTLMATFKSIIQYTPEFKFLLPSVKFKAQEIVFANGSFIYFTGLRDQTKEQVKGLIADIFWFDEANNLSKETYELLVPSIRENNSKVIISFNPQYDFDFVSQEFILNEELNRGFVKLIKINAQDNPYHTKEIERQIKHDQKRMPPQEFQWKWEGGFKPQSETALFDYKILGTSFFLRIAYKREDYTRIVIGVDPATTSKDFSNRTGIAVVGLNHQGKAVLLKDASGILTPNQMASVVSTLYHQYECDCVVVEVNQGGDYIKTTIWGTDPSLKVKEVRAKQDKINRMLPIANEVYLGNILCLDEKTGEEVSKEFRKFTSNGYLGAKGESPDRAEAFAWGVYELLGIQDYGTQGLVFKKEFIANEEIPNRGINYRTNLACIYFEGNQYGLVVCDIKDDGTILFNFTHARKGEVVNLYKEIEGLSFSQVIANDVGMDEVLMGINCNKIDLVEDFTLPLEEITLKTIPIIKNCANVLQCDNFNYEGILKNWLMQDLLSFHKENKESFTPLVYAFCFLMLELK